MMCYLLPSEDYVSGFRQGAAVAPGISDGFRIFRAHKKRTASIEAYIIPNIIPQGSLL